MAITAESHNNDVVGVNRMDCGFVTTDDATEIALGVNLTSVKSINLTPSPTGAISITGGSVTFTPAITGTTYFTAIGE